MDVADVSERYRNLLAKVHDGHDYYEKAEQWLGIFWDNATPFRELFERLDLSNTIELACGHGHHAAQVADRVGKITLVDVNQPNIDACRSRFTGRNNVYYYLTSGNELSGLTSASYTSLYCYDAMVHFEALDVIAYLKEIHRIFKPGALALLHYSNNDTNPEQSFDTSIHWRNFFSAKMMTHFATRLSFDVLENRVINWPPDENGVKNLDAIVLLAKR